MKFIFVLILALSLHASDFENMKASFDKGDINRAISIARTSAMSGSIEAMYDVGLLYYASGKTKEAKTWLERSIKNDGKGSLGLAILKFEQTQNRKGYEVVMELLINVPKGELRDALMDVSRDMATNRKDASASAYLTLAELYYYDRVVRPNLRVALYLTKQAAQKGNKKALELMGDAYWRSNYTRDTLIVAPQIGNALNIAMEYYQRAMRKENFDAMAKLGKLHIVGPRNLRRIQYGVSLILKSAEANSSVGAQMAGELYASGQGVRANRGEAIRWYKKATDICVVNHTLAKALRGSDEGRVYAQAYEECTKKASAKRQYHLLFEAF